MTRSLFSFILVLCLAHLGLLAGSAEAQNPEPEIVAARIGFQGVYKLGCWTPIEVDLQGGTSPYTGLVVVSTSDSDGVPTQIASPRPVGIEPGMTTTARFIVRVGQSNERITVRFLSAGKELAKKSFRPGLEENDKTITGGRPATDLLLLEFGNPLGLGGIFQSSESYEPTALSVRVEDASQLPSKWYGYESIDTVLLTTSSAELYRPLMQNSARLNALREWVMQGGRLVVFCGSNGDELLAADGPLAGLIPGKYEPPKEPTKLRQSQPLETFCNADSPISGDRKLALPVSRLTDIRGQILAYEGRNPSDLPLVIHGQLGFGELLFVGVDFDRPPLLDWKERSSFFKELLQWKDEQATPQSNMDYGQAYMQDLTIQIRDALEKSFQDIEPVPFGLVAFLVLAYILLIGPGDYFLVNKVFRRAELTWLTFPVMVIGISVLAYWFANWMKGDDLRVNQLEIVDVDTLSGEVRGTALTHFYSPRVNRYDLSFQPETIVGAGSSSPEMVISWLGMPGQDLGGMQSGGSDVPSFDSGYAFKPDLTAMDQVPVQVWSAKSISARWKTTGDFEIPSKLVQRGEELRGSFTNPFDVVFEDCHLLYGKYAYHLANVNPGNQGSINRSKLPRRVKTLLTNATAGDESESKVEADGTVRFQFANLDVARVAKLAMFYDAINGFRYANMLHRYQSYLDMSGLLENEDVAILMFRVSKPGSQWLDGAQPLGSDRDRHWTYYRIILPVSKPTN